MKVKGTSFHTYPDEEYPEKKPPSRRKDLVKAIVGALSVAVVVGIITGLAVALSNATEEKTPPVGEWSAWEYLSCSTTCGSGEQIRERNCMTQLEQQYGSFYSTAKCETNNGTFDSEESEVVTCINPKGCPEQICLPDGSIAYKGEWSDWEYTTCPATCGEAQKTRHRICLNSDVLQGNVVCASDTEELYSVQSEIISCDNSKCPPKEIILPDGTVAYVGHWTDWETTPCSATCGNSRRTRERTCVIDDISNENIVCLTDEGSLQSSQYEILVCEKTKCPPEEIVLPDGTIVYKGEWADWELTTCSATCGEAQKTRHRTCVISDDSLNNIVCDSENGELESFQFEVIACDNPKCLAGRVVVEDTIINLRTNMASNDKNFDDKQFLRRYAESVTNYGAVINVEAFTGGAGIWRLEESDALTIIQAWSKQTKQTEKVQRAGMELTRNFVTNMELACTDVVFNESLVMSSAADFLLFMSQEPCASATALLTTLNILGKVIPIEPMKQRDLQESITKQMVVTYEDIIEKEKEELTDRCKTKDFDFEFLIDSSGSVGSTNWRTTVESIADYWIEQSLIPVYEDFGVHVAARWFSSTTDRFIDFHHTAFESSGYKDYEYHLYLGNIMRYAPYISGGTNTFTAIDEIRKTDLPTSRDLGKNFTNVIVFTDGGSSNEAATAEAARKLHDFATVYSVGITDGIRESELKSISSNGQYYKIEEFSDVEHLVNSILNQESTCGEYDCEHIVRHMDNVLVMGNTKGCSASTGSMTEPECGHGCNADKPSLAPPNTTVTDCIACSEAIAKYDVAELNKLEDEIKTAAKFHEVDPFIIAGIISKVTKAGSDLDNDGYVPCQKAVLEANHDEKCYGLMRVPTSHIKDFDSVKEKGCRSWEAISEGIKLLSDRAHCICSNTPLAQRKTSEDIVRINEKAIAAYQVGSSKVPPIGGNDVNDEFDFDFSNDIIARSQFFESELFKT